MVDVYHERGGGNILAVEETAWENVHRYGIVAPKDWQDNHFEIEGMVEKPKRENAPSNLIISGRYILQPQIFAEIEKQEPGSGGEIQITDAMIRLMATQPFHGLKYSGVTYDCGDKIGFLSANVAFALEHEVLGPAFRIALEQTIAMHGGFLRWNASESLADILAKLRSSEPAELPQIEEQILELPQSA
jgi:UTP--glucose-1-phosphate uridylyltransferase